YPPTAQELRHPRTAWPHGAAWPVRTRPVRPLAVAGYSWLRGPAQSPAAPLVRRALLPSKLRLHRAKARSPLPPARCPTPHSAGRSPPPRSPQQFAAAIGTRVFAFFAACLTKRALIRTDVGLVSVRQFLSANFAFVLHLQ